MARMLLELLDYTHGPHRPIAIQIVEAVAKSNLLDLVGRLLVQLEPTIEVSSDGYGN